MFYVEWAQTPKQRKGLMLAEAHLPTILKSSNPGYATVYMFNETDALDIRKSGHSRGFQKYEVTARALIIDLDSLDPAAYKQVVSRLNERDLSFEVWESGGKGFHFYIPHAELTSRHLPYSHSLVAKELVGDLADATLYQHGRLISLPGRIHPVSKKRKRLLDKITGTSELVIPIVEQPETPFVSFHSAPESDAEMLEVALKRIIQMLHKQPEEGKRHVRIWGVARDLALCGIAFDTALDLLTQVNETWTNQKDASELRQAVSKAYQIDSR